MGVFSHSLATIQRNTYMIRKILIFSILLMSVINIYTQDIKLKTAELNSISTLGIIYSEYDTINQGLYDPYFSVFRNEFKNNLTAAGIRKIVFIDDTISFESITNSEIKKICNQYNIDALLISKIYFLRLSFIYKSFLNLEMIEEPSMITGKPDISMELRIFNSHGELIIWTVDKVQTGNSSMVSPQWTINRSLKKNIKKIKKTMSTVANKQ